MITKEKLIADPAIAYDGDSVIAHMRDGAGNSLTSTGGALDTNVTNTVTVSATDLDIRDLAFATDSVDVSGSAVSITGDVNVTQGTDPWVVSATDLDIRDLAFATDSVDVSGSSVSISGDVNVTQGTDPWVVSATDLDIRDLSSSTDSVTAVTQTQYAEDSVHTSGDLGQFILAVRNDANAALAADGDYTPLQTDAAGALKVSGSFSLDGQYAEDSAHTTGDVGIYNLSVRSDQPAISTSDAGDYASQTVDAYNRSWVNTGANVAISNGSVSVTTTSALLVAAAAGRRTITIQNLGNKAMFIGATGVSTTSGVRLAAGGNTQLEIGPNLPLHAVAESGTLDIRWLQLA